MTYVKITEEAFNSLLLKISDLNNRLSTIESMIDDEHEDESYSLIDETYVESAYCMQSDNNDEKPRVIFKK